MVSYPKEYINYLVHFHGDRDWFECHEILEEYWKQQGMKDKVWVGLIQIAVGLYHQRRGNANGAVKMLRNALHNFDDTALGRLGLNPAELRAAVRLRVQQILAGEVFADLNLPIMDQALLAQCMDECRARGLAWLDGSRLNDDQLIHRHTLRDRRDVIYTRQEKLKQKDTTAE